MGEGGGHNWWTCDGKCKKLNVAYLPRGVDKTDYEDFIRILNKMNTGDSHYIVKKHCDSMELLDGVTWRPNGDKCTE